MTVRKPTDQKLKAILEVVMQLRGFIVALALVLSGCGESQLPAKGETGEKGEPGPPGPAGPSGPAGPAGPSGSVIRFVDGECRQPCTVACEENERIPSTFAISPGGRSYTKPITKRISGRNDQAPRSRGSSRAYRNEHRWSTIFYLYWISASRRRCFGHRGAVTPRATE